MISFDAAVQVIEEVARPIGEEKVALSEAHRRVLAAPVVAQIHSPRADVSAMDGYAVRDEDIAIPALLVVGEAYPGKGFAGTLSQGSAVRIFTGAPVPAGADRVVIQENARRDGDRVSFAETGSSNNIRRAGSDFVEGDVLLQPGTRLGPRALVAAAGADVADVIVFRRPRLRLIATGGELVDPGTAREGRATIPESISVGVAALAREWGAEPVGRDRLPDDLAVMRPRAAASVADADIVVVTGGASVGERDFARAMFGDALELIFSKVAIKPGKPVWLGRVGATLVMGLPGNPTSAMVTARLLLAPLIAGLGGRSLGDALIWRHGPSAEALGLVGDRETFSRGQWDGATVRLLSNQDSGAQSTLAPAEILIRRPAHGAALPAGATVQIIDF